MIFTARLRRLTPLWAAWRQDGLVGGTIQGVLFRWRDSAYYTDELNDEQVVNLLHNPFVDVEASGLMPEPDPPKPEVSKPEATKTEPPIKHDPSKPPVAKPVGRTTNGSQ